MTIESCLALLHRVAIVPRRSWVLPDAHILVCWLTVDPAPLSLGPCRGDLRHRTNDVVCLATA